VLERTQHRQPIELYCYACQRVCWHDLTEYVVRRELLGLPFGAATCTRHAICSGCGRDRDVPDQLLPRPRRG